MVLGLKRETVDDVLTVFAAVLIFNTLPKFGIVGQFFQDYPVILFILAIIIIANRNKIAKKIGE